MFETKQYCGLINFKRDMLYYVRCIYTVSSSNIFFIEWTHSIIFTLQENGKYIQSGVSIEDPEFPLQPGVPRMDVSHRDHFL